MRSLVFCLIFIFITAAQARFSRGDNFQYVNIDGYLTIICKNRTKTVTCRDVFMDPWPYDVFVGPRNFHAEVVDLKATDGKEIQSAVVDYDGQTGRSADVNIGVFSLFQKPLLRVGENRVRYSLLDRTGKVLETDVFAVSVTRGKSRTCDAREMHTENPDDCDLPYSSCQQYFKNQNFCR